MNAKRLALIALLYPLSAAPAGEVKFTSPPLAAADGKEVKMTFAVSAPTDVEVAVIGPGGRVVRHLAAGVLGGPAAPPKPLGPGLAQRLTWDRADDLGKPAGKGPFTVRVRAGTGVKFGRFIGGDPCLFGKIDSIASDEAGNIYLLAIEGPLNQHFKTLRLFSPQGRYLRTMLPFPADLPPGSMKDVAAWDEQTKSFRPTNRANLNPEFYARGYRGSGVPLHLVSASRQRGILLTDGDALCKLDARGAVPGPRFAAVRLWSAKTGRLPNSGRGPVFLTADPRGKYLYLSGPFSSKTRYGHKFDKRFPPGRIYRMALSAGGGMREFATIPVGHTEGQGGAWTRSQSPGHFTALHGPVHQTAVDAKGNVYVADREHSRIAVFDESGRQTGSIPVKYPDLVAVHPKTGAIYVMQKDCIGYHRYFKALLRFDRVAEAGPAASYQFGPGGNWPSMAVSVARGRTIVWVAGAGGSGGLIALEDTGDEFRVVQTAYGPATEAQEMFARIAVDSRREEVYVSDGANLIWRYDGKTGGGVLLKKGGRPFRATDLAVGYDGLLYVRTGKSFSGPLARFTHDLEPAVYPELSTHVLSGYIYGRYGIGNAERGLGVGPDGKLYISSMYEWVKYFLAGFGADGKPLAGTYLKGKISEGHYKSGMPKSLDSAIVGPLPQANGGVRVDLAGNIYVGMLYWPKDLPYPEPHKKDFAYRRMTGSVVKFSPTGGSVTGDRGLMRATEIEGALRAYPGLGPFSRNGFGGNTCCVCRAPRFDLDRFGRLVLPNAVTNSVKLVDNAGNEILRFGQYGNFDSRYRNPNLKDEVTVAVPDIPLGWPTGAGISDNHIYVCDTYNRRVVRVDLTHGLTASCPVKQ